MTDFPTEHDLKKLEPEVTDETVLDFGCHKGKKLRDIPDKYLDWLFGEKWFSEKYPKIHEYLEDRLENYDSRDDEDWLDENDYHGDQ